MINPIATPEQPEFCESETARNYRMSLTFSVWHNHSLKSSCLHGVNMNREVQFIYIHTDVDIQCTHFQSAGMQGK